MAKQFCQINDPVLHLKVSSVTPRETLNINSGETPAAVLDVNMADIDGKVIYVTYDLEDANIEEMITLFGVCLRINGDPGVITKKPQFTIINGLVNAMGKSLSDNDYTTDLIIGGSYRFAYQDYHSEYDGYTGNSVTSEYWYFIPAGMTSGCAFISLVSGSNDLFLSTRLSDVS